MQISDNNKSEGEKDYIVVGCAIIELHVYVLIHFQHDIVIILTFTRFQTLVCGLCDSKDGIQI